MEQDDDIERDDFGLFPSQDEPQGGGAPGAQDDDDDTDPKEAIKRLRASHNTELQSVRAELEGLRKSFPSQQAQPQNPYAFQPQQVNPEDAERALAQRFDQIAAERGIGAANPGPGCLSCLLRTTNVWIA